MRTTMSEIKKKYMLEEIDGRLDTAEEKISDRETQQQKLSKMGKKLFFLNEQIISELQDNFKWPNICVIDVPKGDKEEGIEKNLKK